MTIKNGDLPAMPLTGDAYTDLSGHIHKSYGYNPECLGMTKREMMAMHIMSGLVSDPNVDGAQEDIAEAAVKLTDALLRKLGETK